MNAQECEQSLQALLEIGVNSVENRRQRLQRGHVILNQIIGRRLLRTTAALLQSCVAASTAGLRTDTDRYDGVPDLKKVR